MRIRDWSSDVCSSDLEGGAAFLVHQPRQRLGKLRVRIVGSGPALGLDEQRPARPHATQRVVQPRRRGDQLALRRAVEVRPTKPGRALETAVLVQDDARRDQPGPGQPVGEQRRSEEHTSELQSLMRTSYAVFCLKKKTTKTTNTMTSQRTKA